MGTFIYCYIKLQKIGASVNSIRKDFDKTLHEATPGSCLHLSPDKLQISYDDKKNGPTPGHPSLS